MTEDNNNNIEAETFWPEEILENWKELNDLEERRIKWIAHRLMKLTLSVGEGMTGEEVDEYTRLFK